MDSHDEGSVRPDSAGRPGPEPAGFSSGESVSAASNGRLHKRLLYLGVALVALFATGLFVRDLVVDRATDSMYESITGEPASAVGEADVSASVGGSGATTTLHAPATPGGVAAAEMEAMSADEFAEVDTVPRLDFYGPRIDEWRDGAYSVLFPLLSDEDRAIVSSPLPTDKSEYTSQDILNAYAIDVADASSQNTGTQKDIEEGRKIQSVIMSPEHPGFDRVTSKIGNGQGTIVSVNKVVESYPRLRNVTFRGHAIGSAGAELIRYESSASSEIGFGLFTLIMTPSGNSMWQFTDQYEDTDRSLGSDLAQALKNSEK